MGPRQGAIEVYCKLGFDLPGSIHIWFPKCTYVWTLVCRAHLVNLNVNGSSRIGFGVYGLAFGWLRCLHQKCWCALESVHASRGLIDNWYMPVVFGLLMGEDWFWCPLSFFGVGGAVFLRLTWVFWS